MNKKIIIFIVAVVVLAAVLAGCTESFKQKAIDTDFSGINEVTSNGGLAVKAGKYLYYINGYAGNTVPNTFGKVEKGAIARVELDAGGQPIDSTNKIIVPKNVYSSVATSGLYIVKDYVYYSSPSTDKNSKGVPKTSEMHLLRTKLDGSKTDVIAKFKDFTPVYRVVDGYILYVNSERELHQINLNDKKFKSSMIDSSIVSYAFAPSENAGSFSQAIVYAKTTEKSGESFTEVYSHLAGQSKKLVFDGSRATYGDTLTHPSGYTIKIVESLIAGNNLRLIYTKTDSSSNKRSDGTYAFDFDLNFTFAAAREERYSMGSVNYTGIKLIPGMNNGFVALSGNNLVQVVKDSSENRWKEIGNLVELSAAPTILSVNKSGENLFVYYLASSVVYRADLKEVVQEGKPVTFAIQSVNNIFSGKFNATWIGLDLVGDVVYFFNTDVLDYTYFLNISKVDPRNADTKKATLLSLVAPADEIGLIEGKVANA